MSICGVLVHCAPGAVDALEHDIAALAGAEVHQRTGNERLIVTVEDTGSTSAGDTILAIHRLPGVIAAALTFHSFEDLSGEPGCADHQTPQVRL